MQPQHFARKPFAKDSPKRGSLGVGSRGGGNARPGRSFAVPHGAPSGGGDTLSAMPLGPLGVTALLAALDWGAWDWATNNNQTTVGLIAGLLMAPIAVAFAWSLARVLVALARLGIARLTTEARPEASPLSVRTAERPFDIEAQSDRLAA